MPLLTPLLLYYDVTTPLIWRLVTDLSQCLARTLHFLTISYNFFYIIRVTVCDAGAPLILEGSEVLDSEVASVLEQKTLPRPLASITNLPSRSPTTKKASITRFSALQNTEEWVYRCIWYTIYSTYLFLRFSFSDKLFTYAHYVIYFVSPLFFFFFFFL